jgi:hypothetical protein
VRKIHKEECDIFCREVGKAFIGKKGGKEMLRIHSFKNTSTFKPATPRQYSTTFNFFEQISCLKNSV